MKLTPFLTSFAAARASATAIFKVINRSSKIDSLPTDERPSDVEVKGNISFKNVYFNYPSRPQVQVRNSNETNIFRMEFH